MSISADGPIPPRDAPVDTVLFDLDDTLCRHPESYEDRLARAFDRAGVEPYFEPVDVRRAARHVRAKDPLEFRIQSYTAVAREYNRDPTEARAVAEAFEPWDPAAVISREGAHTVVETLGDRYTLGVVTNTTPAEMETKLEALGLEDSFAIRVAPGERHDPKPEPDMFEYVFAELGAVPDQVVHVGNSTVSDVAGARAAGLRSVWVPTQRDTGAGPEPTWSVDRLTELTSPPWE